MLISFAHIQCAINVFRGAGEGQNAPPPHPDAASDYKKNPVILYNSQVTFNLVRLRNNPIFNHSKYVVIIYLQQY